MTTTLLRLTQSYQGDFYFSIILLIVLSNPWAPVDMPDKAWSNWAELRSYSDCTKEALNNANLGQINVTMPDSKTRELR